MIHLQCQMLPQQKAGGAVHSPKILSEQDDLHTDSLDQQSIKLVGIPRLKLDVLTAACGRPILSWMPP